MSKIKNIHGREILDSRGNPTIEVFCELEHGATAKASVPSGVSTGAHEAFELRDKDQNRFNGLGVLMAVHNVNTEIRTTVLERDFDQKTLDELLVALDGTANKSRLGANAILGVSLAFARACSREHGIALYEYIGTISGNRDFQLPQPSFNMIEGGKHSESGLAFQEFMLLPQTFESMERKVGVIQEIASVLKSVLEQDGEVVNFGDEGGVAPKLSSSNQALGYLERAIILAGYDTERVSIGLDVAATTFYKEGRYEYEGEHLHTEDMIRVYETLCNTHNIISIEDGLQEEDFSGFQEMNHRLGGRIHIVGDDLTVTNIGLIEKAIKNKAINTLLIKPNQIGTLSETVQAVHRAQMNDVKVFISHRGGETDDTFIADLAVAVGADFIKSGGPTKPERICKYERLIEIENSM